MKLVFVYRTDSQSPVQNQLFHGEGVPRVGEEVELFDEESGNTLRFRVQQVRWEFLALMGQECQPWVGIALGEPVAVFAADQAPNQVGEAGKEEDLPEAPELLPVP